MNNKLVTFVLLPGLFFLTSTMVRADETDSSISVELGRDNNNGTGRYVDLTLGLTGGMQFLVSQGQSETNDTSGDLQTDSWSIGLASDPATDVSVAVYYSNWVDKDALEIDTLALDLILNTNDWGLIVSPQTRDIEAVIFSV